MLFNVLNAVSNKNVLNEPLTFIAKEANSTIKLVRNWIWLFRVK